MYLQSQFVRQLMHNFVFLQILNQYQSITLHITCISFIFNLQFFYFVVNWMIQLKSSQHDLLCRSVEEYLIDRI